MPIVWFSPWRFLLQIAVWIFIFASLVLLFKCFKSAIVGLAECIEDWYYRRRGDDVNDDETEVPSRSGASETVSRGRPERRRRSSNRVSSRDAERLE